MPYGVYHTSKYAPIIRRISCSSCCRSYMRCWWILKLENHFLWFRKLLFEKKKTTAKAKKTQWKIYFIKGIFLFSLELINWVASHARHNLWKNISIEWRFNGRQYTRSCIDDDVNSKFQSHCHHHRNGNLLNVSIVRRHQTSF